jgi:hypothetical protein
VDSSKTAWASAAVPFRLSRKLGQDFLLVHVVRDPRGVSWSVMRTPWRPKKGPRDSAIKAALRTAFGWIAANLACELFGWLYPESYIRVRYEDLSNAPVKSIANILQRVSLVPPSSLRVEARKNRHQLYGNAMRYKLLSPADVKEDSAWKTMMPKAYRRLVACLCWPLLMLYGYDRLSPGSVRDNTMRSQL